MSSSATYYPAASGDDGFVSNLYFYNSDYHLYIGNNGATLRESFIRFDGVAIPQGSTVITAILTLTASTDASDDDCNIDIHFVDADDPAAPTTKDGFNALSLTTGINWDSIESWTQYSTYNTPELKTAIQGVIDRPGWGSGQAVIAVLKNDGSDNDAYRRAYAWDFGTHQYKAELYIEWTSDRDIQCEPLISTSTLHCATAVISGMDITCVPFQSTGDLASSGVSWGFDITVPAMSGTGMLLMGDIIVTEILNPAIRYFGTLTGADDGLDDVELPMASFQCRQRSGEPTYLSLITPYSAARVSEIADRPSGELVIEMALIVGGVEQQRDEIIRVTFEAIRSDEGARNKTITLSGTKTTTFTPKAVTLDDPIYRLNDDGKIMLRFGVPDIYLRPGDTLTAGDDEIEVGLITYYVSVSDGGGVAQQMDVQEAEE